MVFKSVTRTRVCGVFVHVVCDHNPPERFINKRKVEPSF